MDIIGILFILLLVYTFLELNKKKEKPHRNKLKKREEPEFVEAYVNKEDYKEKKRLYFRSEKWRENRLRTLLRDNYSCQSCLSPENLQVHHITYVRIFEEHQDDLVTLCSICHNSLHKELGYDNNDTFPIK